MNVDSHFDPEWNLKEVTEPGEVNMYGSCQKCVDLPTHCSHLLSVLPR